MDNQSLAHSRYNCTYHIVWIPKYRRKALYGEYRREMGSILKRVCELEGIQVIKAANCMDHVHMYASIPPKKAVSSVIGRIKGKSTLMFFDRHPELRKKYQRHFWARGYYCETVGNVNEETIKNVFSVTDHDSIAACRRIRRVLSDDDPVLINGVEFSCRDESGKYHILGYGYRPDGKMICDLAGKTHQMRMEKARGRLKVLKVKYGYSFSDEDIKKLLSLDNPGKPHIGNLMVQYGYASSKDEAIENVLDHIHVHTGSIMPEEAILAIRESGGLAILAHPPFGNGSQFITGERMKERILRLKNLGLDGLETWYSGYDARLREEMKDYADCYDLLATAGSDYHGSNKKVKIGETGLEDADADVRVRAFLRRCI